MTGTSGTTDVMNVRIINAGTAGTTLTFAGLQTSGVERLNFSLTDGTDGINTNSIATGSFTGATTLAVAGSSNVNTTSTVYDIVAFTGVAATVALELGANTSQTSVSVTTVGTSTSGDSFTLNTVGGSNGVVTLTDAAADGFVTVNIASSGTVVSTIKTLDTKSSNTTVNVTGAGALTVTDALGTSVKTLDASAATGIITMGVAASTTLSAKGGTGTTDKLAITAIDSTLTSGAVITGFETVSLDTTAAGTGTFALTQITGATAINIAATTTGANGTLNLTKAASAQGLNYVGNKSATAAYLFDNVTQTLTTDGTAATDAIAITINNAGTASTGSATAGTVGLLNYEVVTLTVADFATSTIGALSLATGATSLTINAATNLVVGGVNTATTTLTTVNAGGSAGNVTLGTIVNTGAMTYTGSLGIDTLTTGDVAAATTQTFNLGTGSDVITLGTPNATSTFAINGEAGDDTVIVAQTVVTGTVFNIDGGTGVDTLRFSVAADAAVFIDSLIGVEKFANVSASTITIAASSTAANNSIEITQIGAATTVFTTTVAQTVSIAGVTSVGSLLAARLLLTGSTGAEILTGSSTVGTTVNGAGGADTITTGAAASIVIGGTGADTITLGALNEAIDMVTFVAGDSAATFTGAGTNAGTAVGFDNVTNFKMGTGAGVNSDTLNVEGTGAVAANATFATDSTLWISGAVVASSKIATGVATFFASTDASGTALTINSAATVAAALETLSLTDIGGAGDSAFFTATIGTVAHTYVYTQAGTGAGGDVVDLIGLTGLSLNATNATTAGLIFIA